MFVAQRLLAVTQDLRPDLYEAILRKIQPYTLESVLKIFEQHMKHIPDLQVFNDHVERVPEFVWAVIRHMQFPAPGDPIGILKICRVTKSDTQGALDSKHIQAITNSPHLELHVEKDIIDELALFSNHMHLFELANRHKYATVFLTDDTTLPYLMDRLPHAGLLTRGNEYNKGQTAQGVWEYLSTFKYIVVEDRGSVKVLYKSLNDLFLILRRVPLKLVVAFSDVRCVFKKAGVTCTFFNMVQLARLQLFVNDDSKYEKDVVTLLTLMFCRGELLPMNREGLAKNKDNPPIDVLSFEAMKRNSSKIVTGPMRGVWHNVRSSSEKVFWGQQFNEGTGYTFGLYNRGPVRCFQLQIIG